MHAAAGDRPAPDPLFEEEPVVDQLTASVEQIDERPVALRAFEAVVALDLHHRHALPFRGELVHRARDRLLTVLQRGQSRVPLGLADDGRASDGHR